VIAARYWGRSDVRVEEVADPGLPKPGFVRLRVEACGICGTDVDEYVRGPNLIPTTPHPLTQRAIPITLGHEVVGVVDDGGSDGPPRGTRVAVDGTLFCGECWWCTRRSFQLCRDFASIGLMADGGLAEVMVVPSYMCIPIHSSVQPDTAVLAEPLAVAVRSVRRGAVKPGSSVAIFGAGCVGLLTLQVARAAGANTVLVVEPLADRRQLALDLGADIAVDPASAAEATGEITAGIGVDVAFEAAGVPAAAEAAVRLIRKGGRAVLLGVYQGQLSLSQMDLLMGEKEIVGSLGHVYDDDFVSAVRLLEDNSIATAPLVSDRIPLAEIVDRGLRELATNPNDHLKIVVYPSSTG
jgi:(R,R)-butanediol dehydrogenase/meso-butanediol dehydrogenase/diacetyl reductase